MLAVLKTLAQSGSFRRFLVFLLTAGATLVHRKFGFEIEASTIEWLVGLAMVYIGGGNLKDAIVARAGNLKAAAPEPSLAEAVKELQKPILDVK